MSNFQNEQFKKPNPEDVSKTIEDSVIVPLLVKLVITDLKYSVLLKDRFKKAWLPRERQNAAMLIEMTMDYFKTTGQLPTFPDLGAIISKEHASTNRDLAKSLLVELQGIKALDLSGYTRDFLDKECIHYIKKISIFTTLMTNMDNLTNPDKVFEFTRQTAEFHSMSFDNDLGMDFLRDIRETLKEFRLSTNRIPIGIKFFDDMLKGGLPAEGKNLSVFIAGTHVGKSLVISNIAANALRQNKFALVVSLEMSEIVYSSRICCHIAQQAPDFFEDEKNDAFVSSKVDEILRDFPEAKLVVKEMPPATTCCRDIQSYVKKLIQTTGRKPDIILIDYLTIVGPNDPKAFAGQNTGTRYKAVAEEMRALSYVFECPVVTAAQLNRDGANDTSPTMEQIGESYAIAQTADFAALLYWKNQERDRDANMVYVSITKNRIGGRFAKDYPMIMNYRGDLRMLDVGEGIKCSLGPRSAVSRATDAAKVSADMGTDMVDAVLSQMQGLGSL